MTAAGRARARRRRRRYSLTVLVVLGILFAEAVPIGVAAYLTHRDDHQWCALVDVLNAGPRPTSAYGLKVARAFNDRARSLGC